MSLVPSQELPRVLALDDGLLAVALEAVARAAPDLDTLLPRILDWARRLTGARHAGILEVVDDELTVLAGTDPMLTPNLRLPIEGTLTGLAMRTGDVAFSTDLDADPRFSAPRRLGSRSAVAVPLTYRDRTIALLTVASPEPDAFDAGTATTLRRLGAVVAAKLDHVATLDSYVATVDALRESERRMRQAMEATLEGLAMYDAVTDEGGRPVDLVGASANASAQRIRPDVFGPGFVGSSALTRGALSGHAGAIEAYLDVARTGRPLRRRITTDGPRGQRFYDVAATRMGTGVLVSFRDVTEEYEQEAAIRRAHAAQAGVIAALEQVAAGAGEFAAATEPSRVAEVVATIVRSLHGADIVSVLLADVPGEPLLRPLAVDGPNHLVRPRTFDVSDPRGALGRAWAQGRPVFIADVSTSPLVSPGLVAVNPTGSALFLPVPSSAGPLGVVCVFWIDPIEVPTSISERAVGLVLAQAGDTLRRLLALVAASSEATRDPLTGLGNRRLLEAAVAALPAGGALLFCDLDHFKGYNDQHGHAAGDALLQRFAAVLGSGLRDGDTVCRYGGEEFVVVLPDGAAAEAVHRRLDEAWRRAVPAVTFSAGLALREAGETAAGALRRADVALYAAKAAGRARLVHAGPVVRLA